MMCHRAGFSFVNFKPLMNGFFVIIATATGCTSFQEPFYQFVFVDVQGDHKGYFCADIFKHFVKLTCLNHCSWKAIKNESRRPWVGNKLITYHAYDHIIGSKLSCIYK